MATTMVRDQGRQAVAIEPCHPARNGVADLAPHKLRRRRVALPLGHGQQSPGTRNLGRRSTLRPAQPGERYPLRLAQSAEQVLLPP